MSMTWAPVDIAGCELAMQSNLRLLASTWVVAGLGGLPLLSLDPSAGRGFDLGAGITSQPVRKLIDRLDSFLNISRETKRL